MAHYKCFHWKVLQNKKNQELKENLEKTFGKFSISKIKKIGKCQAKRERMKANYVIHTKSFETRTTEGVLRRM